MKLVLALAAAAALMAQERYAGSADLDRAIEAAVAARQIPGAVCAVGQPGKILHRAAYGSRALVPRREPMTLDTVFDVASLTKVVATTSAMMKLFEQGRVRLNDPVTDYLPGFQGGKSGITVRQLLTHYSGLRPDVDIEPAWSGYEEGIRRALTDKPVAAPGERFIYSDINFILLGEIVRVVTGKTLPEYVRENVFLPLGMRETRFQPESALRPRIAPTEILKGTAAPLRGVVHDPTTRYMGGVAGHAGLFTTADDLARFAEALLDGGKGVFQPATIAKFTSPNSPPDRTQIRGLGWDIDTRFSSNRGELFPVGSYGHTGFTGTSLWIDPVSRTYVILLANSVHPKVTAPISSLRSRVATIAAAHAGVVKPGTALTSYNEAVAGASRAVARNGHVLTGLDILVESKFAPLQGKRVGLVSNHTGIDRLGRRNVDLMREAGVHLVALFSPEHGFAGAYDQEKIANTTDHATGLPVYSLYDGNRRRPLPETLEGIDTLVFDIQDIGARFYTYMCTMRNAMEEASKKNIAVLVLDRPNPVTGTRVEGPLLDASLESFVGCFGLPLRHGMTMGELALMFRDGLGLQTPVEVVKMQGWERGDWFDSTGLPWVNPSPNIRSLNAALLYPGIGMIEYSKNYSVGRGTDAPFEWVGAEFIRGAELAAWLNGRSLAGVRVYPVKFRPESSNLAGRTVEGVRFMVTDREQFDASRLGLELASALVRLYPGKIVPAQSEKLIGQQKTVEELAAGVDARLISERIASEMEAFLAKRRKFLLY